MNAHVLNAQGVPVPFAAAISARRAAVDGNRENNMGDAAPRAPPAPRPLQPSSKANKAGRRRRRNRRMTKKNRRRY